MSKNLASLIIAFAAAASIAAPNVVAGKTPHQNLDNETPAVLKKNNYKYLTQHCPPKIKEPPRKWTWDEAMLTARLLQGEDEKALEAKFLDKKNIDTKLPIASITKSMTAYLVFAAIRDGKISLHQRIPVLSESLCFKDSEFAIKYLPEDIMQTGITVSDALTHTLRLSSNPMAYNLAIAVAGSESKFVEKMNKTAKDWGMDNTHFINSHGLPVGDRKSEYTTARDLLKMAEHIAPDFDLFQAYSHARVMVETALYFEKEKKIKNFLRSLGAVFKTATINQCKSLFTIAEDGDDKIVSIQLCAKRDKMARIKEILESILVIKGADASPR